ncbi:MAG: DMT family transporter [Candidatus Heimdallarchaeota archaeon]|nr:DMT family transporter [Candidatus Heimdallarchaeota archaeon]
MKNISVSNIEIQNQSQKLTYILLTFTAFFWGSAFPVAKIVTEKLPPATAALYRFVIALPIFFIIAKVKTGQVGIKLKYHAYAAIFGIQQVAMYNYLFFKGVSLTSASNATLIVSTGPIIIAVIASFLFADERLTRGRIVGLISAFVGVVLIITFSPNKESGGLTGDLIIFLSAVIFATYTLFSRYCFKFMSPYVLTAWGAFYGIIVLFFLSLPERDETKTIDGDLILALLYLSLAAGVIGFLVYNWGANEIGPTRASIFVNSVPMFGVITSVVILDEVFSVWHVISFSMIVAGVYIVNKYK